VGALGEAKLAAARNTMLLGYTDPETGGLHITARASMLYMVALMILKRRASFLNLFSTHFN
jgi:hypothetical protein